MEQIDKQKLQKEYEVLKFPPGSDAIEVLKNLAKKTWYYLQ